MCGIVGIVGPNATLSSIKKMIDSLVHRGPDAEGMWLSPDVDVALGHRRLSVLDLSSASAQPMIDLNTGVVLTYNGEIYNFKEIRRELQVRGINLKTSGDTEVLLRAYIEWREACVNYIEGMFAFAIYDKERSLLFLARDRVGQKPLYYTQLGDTFLFSSEIKAILKLGLVQRNLNLEGLQDYLAYGYTLGPETLIRGVNKVLPGECITFDIIRKKIQCRKYWSIPPLEVQSAYVEEIDSSLENILADAIKRHLVADVPIGILLSGGIDSSLLTALAANHLPSRLKTFTAVFPGMGRFNESPFAKIVAEYFDTEHIEVEIGVADPDILTALSAQFDDPIADHAMVPMYLLSREIRKHATVALGGDGGDELFAGYKHYNLVRQQQEIRSWVPGIIRGMVSYGAAKFLPVGTAGRNHFIGLSGSLGNAIAHVNMYFDAYSRAKLLNNNQIQFNPEEKRLQYAKNLIDPLSAAIVTDFLTTLPEGYLAKLDRASMLASLEMRAPFLDDRLVDFSWRYIPPSYKWAKGRGKAPLRRLARKLLPKSLNLERKQGLTMPLANWFSGRWGAFLKEVLTDPEQDIFSRSFIANLIKNQERGYANQNRLFALVIFLLWRKEYGIYI